MAKDSAADWRGAIGAALAAALLSLALALRAPGFFWRDDAQSYHLPVLMDAVRGWSEGAPPLLSPYSWSTANLAGEYQAAIFSPVVMGLSALGWALPLPLDAVAALIAIAHLAILAAGTYLLAGARGASRPLALACGLAVAFSGWIITWGAANWWPALTSFAWLPWLWWALERGRAGGGHTWAATPFLALIVTAGWPFTVVMAACVAVWHLGRLLAAREYREAGRVVVAGLCGLGLAAPAWMTLVGFTLETRRAQAALEWQLQWRAPLASLPALWLPSFPAGWTVGAQPIQRASLEWFCGWLPIGALVAALSTERLAFLRRHRALFVLLAVALAASMLPSLGVFRWSFRWLPLVHLVLALVALEALKRPEARPGAWTAGGLTVTALVAPLFGGPGLASPLVWPLLGLAAGWAVLERIWPMQRRAWLWPVVVLAASWIVYAPAPLPGTVTPRWRFTEALRDPAPLAPDRRYMSVYTTQDLMEGAATGELSGSVLRPSCTNLIAGLTVVNGYSPLMPVGLADVFAIQPHGALADAWIAPLLARSTGPDGLLALMGVDGVIVSRSQRAAAAPLSAFGWARVAAEPEGEVYHRPGPPAAPVFTLAGHVPVWPSDTPADERLWTGGTAPRFLVGDATLPAGSPTSFSPAHLGQVAARRLSVEAHVSRAGSFGPMLVVFRRPYFAGYRATLEGAPLPVHRFDGLMPAVVVPAGAQGRLVLRYEPPALTWGLSAAGAALAVWGLGLARWRRQKKFSAA